MKKWSIVLAATLAMGTAAQAHQIWIEQTHGGNAVIRFGEFGENLREASPGLLDNFGKPTATLISPKGEQAVDAVKSAAGFTLPFKAGEGDTIVADDAGFKLNRFKRGDRDVASWFRPGARYATSFAEQAPKLALDIVPAGKAGTFKIFFQGQAHAQSQSNCRDPIGLDERNADGPARPG